MGDVESLREYSQKKQQIQLFWSDISTKENFNLKTAVTNGQ